MKLKDALETLDITFEIDDEAMLTDVVVIARVSRVNGNTSMVYASTQGTDHITRLGLVTAAQRILGDDWRERRED